MSTQTETQQAEQAAPALAPAPIAQHAIEPIPQHQLKPAQAFDLSPKSLDEALRMADLMSKSDIVPKQFIDKPGNILVAIQWGMELGLKPMQAMQNIAVINGRPSLWGDAMLALVVSSPICEYVVEDYEPNTQTAICRAKRRGTPEQVRTFSVEDAKAANLLGKDGPWKQYQKRMQQMRARAFALRDVFPDVLKGMPIAEEIMDIVAEAHASNRPYLAVTAPIGDKPGATRTPEIEAKIGELEKVAKEKGFEAFKNEWSKLPKETRAAIGLNERDRIGELGTASDKRRG